MSVQMSNPKAVAEAGDRIYRAKFQESFEQQHRGKFVAIDVNSEEAYLGDTPEEAINKARQASPKGAFHLVRVGFPSAFQISYARPAYGNQDWIFG